MILRQYQIEQLISQKRVLIIYGPRRAGKTTLLKEFLEKTNLKFKFDSGENIKTQFVLSSKNLDEIKEYASGYELLAINEAQYIPDIGMGLKILIDHVQKLYIIVTGSSSFNLSQTVGEPLTGRKRTLILFPLSQSELINKYSIYELKEKLDDFLIFGSYPEVITAKSRKEKIFILNELVDSYLLKDIFAIGNIKASKQLVDLLKLVAFQVGNEVSLNELSSKVGLDVKTIGKYLDLLEKGFVLKKINGFSRNLRNEITSKAKYFFIDNGVRNAVISQYNSMKDRNDVGALFENFVFAERLKSNEFRCRFAQLYFWRTHQGQEIDLVEEYNGKLCCYECKWSEKVTAYAPELWRKTYPGSKFKVINRSNYLDFLLKGK